MPSLPFNNVITSALRGGPNIITQGLVGIGLLPPEWGIFENKSGRSVITFSTVKDVDYRKDWAILDYPIERGSFETYNKVETSYEGRITFVAGGFAATQDLIDSVEAIAGNLKLYDLVTPEKTLTKCNVEHVDWRRRNPVGIIELSLFVKQIRNSVSSELSTSTKTPEGNSTTDGGQVQPQEYDAASKAKIEAAFYADTAPPAAVLGGGPS